MLEGYIDNTADPRGGVVVSQAGDMALFVDVF